MRLPSLASLFQILSVGSWPTRCVYKGFRKRFHLVRQLPQIIQETPVYRVVEFSGSFILVSGGYFLVSRERWLAPPNWSFVWWILPSSLMFGPCFCFHRRTTTTGASEQSSRSWWWPAPWRGEIPAERRIKCWCELWETSTSPRSWRTTCPSSWGWSGTCSPLWTSPGRETPSSRSTSRNPSWISSCRRRTILCWRYIV